jgi:hypothetical protein
MSPLTPDPSFNEGMCIFGEFLCLYDLGIPVVAHLGAVPQEALNLESFLPRRLGTMGLYDDICAVDVGGEC